MENLPTPREGVDYLIDLYAILDAPHDVAQGSLRGMIARRLRDYHSDRQQDTAEEFRNRSNQMTRLIIRAKDILLDEDKRAEYDEILAQWDGPISKTGEAVMTLERYFQLQVQGKTPAEVEAIFAERAAQAKAMVDDNPATLALMEKLVTSTDPRLRNEARDGYEAALLRADRILAIEQDGRARLLGLRDDSPQKYVAALGHGEQIARKLDTQRTKQKELLNFRALGGVGTQLALLAGDRTLDSRPVFPPRTTLELPDYYDDQVEKVKEIAKQREVITKKRLANFEPIYPEPALQTEFKPNLAISIADNMWLAAKIDREKLNVNIQNLPPTIEKLLRRGDIAAAIKKGFNVAIIPHLDHIDTEDLLSETIQKYIEKYSNSGTSD